MPPRRRKKQYLTKKKGDDRKSPVLDPPRQLTHPKTSSPFISLPAELRLRIYEYLSNDPTSVSFPGFRNKRNHLVITNILLTCRLLYQEFLLVAYREINLGIHTQRFNTHRVPPNQAWTGSFTWTGSSEPGQPPVEHQGDPLSSEDQWPEFTRACGNIVRKISMRYKQTSYLKEALQEVIEYAKSLIERFPILDLLEVHIIIQKWRFVDLDLRGRGSDSGGSSGVNKK